MNKIYYAGLVTVAVLLIGFASPQIFGFLSSPIPPVSTETPNPTSTVTPTSIPTQTDTPMPIPTQSPISSPTPTSPIPTSTPTPTASPSPTPAQTPYPNPSSAPTPKPNQSPTPTPTPTTSGAIQLGYYMDTKRYSWEMSQFQSENYGWLHAQAEYLAPYADKSVHYDYQGFMTETEASTELAILIESQIASQIIPTPAPTPTLTPIPSPTATPTTSSTVNIEAYWDSMCTSPISSIDWGLLEAGGSTNRMIYLKNEAAEDVTLSMSLSDWTPTNAEDYITVSWDCEGEVISPDQILVATLICSVSVDINGISAFDVTIVISGTELT